MSTRRPGSETFNPLLVLLIALLVVLILALLAKT